MKASCLWISMIALLSFQTTVLAQDDWIGLNAESIWTTGFRITEDETDDSTKTLYLSLTTSTSITLNLQYADSTLVDSTQNFDSESFYGQIILPISSDFYLGLGYKFEGQQKELEVEQKSINLSYVRYPFFSSLEYSDGNLLIFIRDEIPNELNIPSSVRSDLSASSVEIGWWFDNFSLSALYQSYDYELDISALDSRPLLQLLVKPAALAQTGLLISQTSSFNLTIPLQHRELSWHLFSTRSALDNSDTQSLQMDWIESLAKQTSLFLSLSRSDEAEDNWTISAGLEWNS
jgi:hypothetical protein